MRYLKIFKTKEEKLAALEEGTLDKNSVSIYGDNISVDGIIEYGIGNGEHKLDLGYNEEEEGDTSVDSSSDDILTSIDD